jgi:predicted secreted protein
MRGPLVTETLHCLVGKPFSVRLPVSPTAGYKWAFAGPFSMCRVANERLEAPLEGAGRPNSGPRGSLEAASDGRYGGSSTVVFTLVAVREGSEVLRFFMQRPWEEDIADEHYVRVVAEAEGRGVTA